LQQKVLSLTEETVQSFTNFSKVQIDKTQQTFHTILHTYAQH